MKINKILCIVLFSMAVLYNQFMVVQADSATTSKIYAEIITGELSMSTPNDLSFIAKLNGRKQSIYTDKIQTNITDFRGIDNGWQIAVKSTNYEKYKKNYQLLINERFISDSSVIVCKNEKQLLTKGLVLPTSVEISADAKAGSYGAILEWNLQPNIKNMIKE